MTPCPANVCAGMRVLARLFVGGREDLTPAGSCGDWDGEEARGWHLISVQVRLLLVTAGRKNRLLGLLNETQAGGLLVGCG